MHNLEHHQGGWSRPNYEQPSMERALPQVLENVLSGHPPSEEAQATAQEIKVGIFSIFQLSSTILTIARPPTR